MNSIFSARDTIPLRKVAALLIVTTVWYLNAWVGDDAYVTFRTIDNVLGGYGPTWNTHERVQAFTHPLWLLLLTPLVAVFREPYWTALGVSLLSTLTAAWIAFGSRQTKGPYYPLFIGMLVSSRAWVDFTSSGLETPLSYVLIAALARKGPALRRLDGRVSGITFLSSLLYLNRPDSILLVLPLLAYEWLRLVRAHGFSRELLFVAFVSSAPAVAWSLFALIYYGFVFPNTAYAKLATGIPSNEMLDQGVHYLFNSLRADPVTLLVTALCSICGVTAWKRYPFYALLALGVLLQTGYAVIIGGDFMSGRFFAPGFFASALLIGLISSRSGRYLSSCLFLAALVLYNVAFDKAPIKTAKAYDNSELDPHGIADEKGWYYQTTGLQAAVSNPKLPWHGWMEGGIAFRLGSSRAVARMNIGMFGYYAGPEKIIIDVHGLTEPFLARLAAEKGWRIGHFRRECPPGFVESQYSGKNEIATPAMREYYGKIISITRGPLFTWERWKNIWELNIRYPTFRRFEESTAS